MKNTLYLALIILLTTPVFSQNFVDKPVWQFNVLFDVGKSDIKSVYLSKLDSLANGMLTDSAFQVKITAHTDNTGSDVSNEKLSKNRAEAIKKILIQRNIDENQVAAVWKGEYEPVADNYTEGGKEQNRRVTIEVFRRIYLAKITSVIKNDSGIAVQNAFVTMRSKYLIDSTRTDSLGIFSINVPINPKFKLQ